MHSKYLVNDDTKLDKKLMPDEIMMEAVLYEIDLNMSLCNILK